jgi:hypothetical protein
MRRNTWMPDLDVSARSSSLDSIVARFCHSRLIKETRLLFCPRPRKARRHFDDGREGACSDENVISRLSTYTFTC